MKGLQKNTIARQKVEKEFGLETREHKMYE